MMERRVKNVVVGEGRKGDNIVMWEEPVFCLRC